MRAIIGVLIGILIGLNVPYHIPSQYSVYVGIGLIAAFDSIFGAVRANLHNKFKVNMFVTGVVGNTVIAVALVYFGNLLNMNLYIAAVIMFGTRIFTNFAEIRRLLISKMENKKQKNEIETEEII
jgi:small basic protein